MHYLVALLLVLLLVAWVGRASSAGQGGPRGRAQTRVGVRTMLGAGAAIVVLVAISLRDSLPLGLGRDDRIEQVAAWPAPPPTPIRLPVPMPVAEPVPAPAPVRVRVKTGTNLRVSPSSTAAVLRAAQQGDVLTRFGGANGWIQVGVTRPEGWVAEGAAVPTS